MGNMLVRVRAAHKGGSWSAYGDSSTRGAYAHVLPTQHVEVAAQVGAVLFAPPAATAERA